MAIQVSPFQAARLKLTGWYLLILAILIIVFTRLTLDAKQSAYVRVYSVINTGSPGSTQVKEFADTFEQFNKTFKERLLAFDVAIFLLCCWLAYFLSGKTLKSIQNMVEEQTAFAADVSHSLRTPLTTINLEIEGYTRTHRQIPGPLKELLQSIQEEVFSVTQLVAGMLTLVRTQTDSSKPRPTSVALNEVVETVTDKMRNLAKAKNQTLLSKYLDPLKINGDANQVKQILYILLDNAIKYSGQRAQIKVMVERQKGFACLIVADTGQGIPKKDLPHVFNRFYRADKKTKGTGLGLSIAAKLVAQQRGTIKVKSKIGEGTIFTLRWPIAS